MSEIDGNVVEVKNPGVREVKKQWSVYEDGALAYQLQEREKSNHYEGNISRRRTVRTDREIAKDVAKEAALEAFREEHEIAERNRQIEEEDRERARQLQMRILREQQEKARKERETDEMLARRLQIAEKQRLDAERQKRKVEQMQRDEQLARRLSQQDGCQQQQHHSRKHKAKTHHVDDSMHALSIDDSRTGQGSHSRSRSLVASSGDAEQSLTVALDKRDSDEESDAIAKLTYDEMVARKLQRQEVQRSKPRSLSEDQQKQLLHDEKIARKMQHEEVMLAKKKTRNRYMQKVTDEIADPPPMVHVSKEKKVPVLAEVKQSNGVTLTDINRPASGSNSPRPNSRSNGGNIMASIDPTYSRPNTNVVLTNRSPLRDHSPSPEPHPNSGSGTNGEAPKDFVAVQGTKRLSGKDKKRSSFFSKLKKK